MKTYESITIKYSIMIIPALLFITGCLSLDPFLFEGETISDYKLDNYTGETECSGAITFLNANNYDKPFVDEIKIQSGKETIYTMLLRPDSTSLSSSDTIILYFHGKSDHIDYYWPRTRLLFATGYPVLVVDYKGFGKSSGEPTEKGLYEDGFSALAYIRNSLNNPKVIVYAFSLGSLVGCEVCSNDAQNQILQLILEAPIGSVETIVQDGTYLNLPGSYVTTFMGNNAEKIKKITIPLLWLHGTKDETLNRETHGLPVWNNYPGANGWYIKVEGSGHAVIPQTIGYERYLKCIRDFIRDVDNKDPLLKSKI